MDRRQSDIACDVVAITQCPKEYFANQYGGKLSANTPEFDQFVDLIRVGMRRCLCRRNGIALGLDRLDHLKDKLQALQFALDFLLEPPWQLISSSSAQAFQPQHSLRVHRLVVVGAMHGAKSLDTVDVLAAFVDEAITLTVQSTVILFGNAWHTYHAPHLWFPTRMRHQRPQQSRRVDAIRLRSSYTSVDLQARRVNYVIAHSMTLEQTV